MPTFVMFGIAAAVLFLIAVTLAVNKKFKYHKYFAYAGVACMLTHVAGAFGLY